MLVDNVEMVINIKILLTIFTIVLELMYGASEGGNLSVSIWHKDSEGKSPRLLLHLEYSAIGSLLAEQRQNRIRVKLSRGKRKIFSLSFQMKKYSLP